MDDAHLDDHLRLDRIYSVSFYQDLNYRDHIDENT